MFCLCFAIAALASASVRNVTSAWKTNIERDAPLQVFVFSKQMGPDRSAGPAVWSVHDVDLLAACAGAKPFRDLHFCRLSVKSVWSLGTSATLDFKRTFYLERDSSHFDNVLLLPIIALVGETIIVIGTTPGVAGVTGRRRFASS